MTLDTQKLRPLFAEWARVMQENKPMLTELDSVVGDGDLGLTMSDGFAAANDVVQHSEERDIGRFFYLAGKAMASAVPSTMGTLMASGLMQAGKIFKGRTTLVTEDASAFFQAWYDGVQQRGKAQPGEKTFLDGMAPALVALKNRRQRRWFRRERRCTRRNGAYSRRQQWWQNMGGLLSTASVHERLLTPARWSPNS